MNRMKKALEKCRIYVAVQKFGCGMDCIGHGVEDSLLQFLDEAFEELAWLEKREPTLMSDCISAGLPLDVALKYDVQLCRLTNYVRDKTLADCVKQEPIDDELKAKLDAFSDLKTILFEPERWTVSEHATYFGFFCWGWKYAKKPYAAPVQPVKQEPVATVVKPWSYGGTTGVHDYLMSDGSIRALTPDEARAINAAPVSAKREWVDLTDAEIVRLYAESPMCDSEMIAFARAVIAAFKEKNNV